MKIVIIVNTDAVDNEGKKIQTVRRVLEECENVEYKNISDFANVANICMQDIIYYELSEFMEHMNDDEIDVVNSFMTYIRVKSTV